MVRIDGLIFGYRKLKIEPEDLSAVTSYLLRASIPSVINNDGTVTVRERDFQKTIDILSGRINFTHSKPLGLYGIWRKISNKWVIAFSVAFAIVLTLLLSELVWDIRIEGNEKISESEIILALSECGLEIGDLWGRINKGQVENDFLEHNKKVSWININRRGTVAYVKLMEKPDTENTIENYKPKFANIVAASDSVIEEITVKVGTPLVKVGDVVRKGDILVAGVLSDDSGGGFCSADATVIGRVNDQISVKIDRKAEILSVESTQLYSFTIKIFKISLNIFKRYGNLTKECDIIEDEIEYSLFDRFDLPLSIRRVYLVNGISKEIEYTDSQLIKLASDKLSSLTASRLENCDLLKISTSGKFSDDGYTMSSNLVFLTSIGELCEFEIE